MATKKRTGLGRGISSLIPTSGDTRERPVDVFFGAGTAASERSGDRRDDASSAEPSGAETTTAAAQGSDASTHAKGASGSSGAGTGRARAAKATTTRTPARSTPAKASSAKASSSNAAASTRRTATAKAAEADVETPVADVADTGEDRESATASTDTSAPDTATAPIDGEQLVPVDGARLLLIEPKQVVPNAWQPRREFDQEALDELTHSVREFGLLQPIVVRPIPDDHPLAGEATYELIMGERRLRASKAAGLVEIPAILKETPNDDMLRDALLENLHRSNLNPLEEASAYQQLLDDFGITQEQLATRIGRSRPQVSNTLRLLRLPIDVQRRVAAGVLSAGHARAILSAGEPAAMTQLAEKIVNEDLSVRAAEAAASRTSNRAGGTAGTAQKSTSGLTGYLDEVGERLGDRLNTRVNVTLRRTKGQIVVDFASVADLNRILVELGEDPTGARDRG